MAGTVTFHSVTKLVLEFSREGYGPILWWVRIQKGTWSWSANTLVWIRAKSEQVMVWRWDVCGLYFSLADIVRLGWTLKCRGQLWPPGWIASAVGGQPLARSTAHHSGTTAVSPWFSPKFSSMNGNLADVDQYVSYIGHMVYFGLVNVSYMALKTWTTLYHPS